MVITAGGRRLSVGRDEGRLDNSSGLHDPAKCIFLQVLSSAAQADVFKYVQKFSLKSVFLISLPVLLKLKL
jgi:hypothetical protein